MRTSASGERKHAYTQNGDSPFVLSSWYSAHSHIAVIMLVLNMIANNVEMLMHKIWGIVLQKSIGVVANA